MTIKRTRYTISDTHDDLVLREGRYVCGCGKPRLREVWSSSSSKGVRIAYDCRCGNRIFIYKGR